MDLDYISTRRLSRFYGKLKDWLSLNYSTKVELAEATQDMRGATEQFAGAHGLVPTPASDDRTKFLKGDGTWAAPPEANLANYYYDDRGNGLSAKRTSYDSPYGTASLVGGHGNMNDYTIDATFLIDWGGIARNFFSVNTYVPGASRIGFGINSTDARAMRYLLPTPVANKYAKTDANGQIVWGDLPAEKDEVAIYTYGQAATNIYNDYNQEKVIYCKYNSKLVPLIAMGSNCCTFVGVINDESTINYSGPRFVSISLSGTTTWGVEYFKIPTPSSSDVNKVLTIDSNGAPQWQIPSTVPSLPSPTINDSLLLGQADGSETWTALENDVFGTLLPDKETGEPMYDASSTDQLWTGFAGKEFGAARAYADQDGKNIKATYATKENLNAALGNIESLLAAL